MLTWAYTSLTNCAHSNYWFANYRYVQVSLLIMRAHWNLPNGQPPKISREVLSQNYIIEIKKKNVTVDQKVSVNTLHLNYLN